MRFARAALVAACLASPGATLAAQGGRPSQLQVERTAGLLLGARAAYGTDRPDAWGWGAQFRVPLDWNLALEPSVDTWAVNGKAWTQGNVDLLALDRGGILYLRLGLAVLKAPGAEAKLGANGGIGADLPYLFQTPLRPFVEARWTAVDGTVPLRVLIGANVVLGQR